MAEDDCAGVWKTAFEATATTSLVTRVVNHDHGDTAEFELQGFRKVYSGWLRIPVTSDGADGSVSGEFVEKGHSSDIARVKDKICLLQVGKDCSWKDTRGQAGDRIDNICIGEYGYEQAHEVRIARNDEYKRGKPCPGSSIMTPAH